MERTTYVVVTWPETQMLAECDGFDEKAYLINDDNGINDFGSGAYFVNKVCRHSNSRSKPDSTRALSS